MLSASLQSVVPSTAGKGVIVCDPEGRVLFCNDMARRVCSPADRFFAVLPPIIDTCFVGFTVAYPDSLGDRCDIGVDTREVALDHGAPARLITLEPRDEFGDSWSGPLRQRFSLDRQGDRGPGAVDSGREQPRDIPVSVHSRMHGQEAHPQHRSEGRGPDPDIHRSCRQTGTRPGSLSSGRATPQSYFRILVRLPRLLLTCVAGTSRLGGREQSVRRFTGKTDSQGVRGKLYGTEEDSRSAMCFCGSRGNDLCSGGLWGRGRDHDDRRPGHHRRRNRHNGGKRRW